MSNIVRKGDSNSAGGKATGGEKSFIVNRRSAVTVGTGVSAHKPCPIVPIHCNATTGGGNATFIINNKRANRKNDPDSCGHARASGSPDFIIGG